jgi:hypothetical protein
MTKLLKKIFELAYGDYLAMEYSRWTSDERVLEEASTPAGPPDIFREMWKEEAAVLLVEGHAGEYWGGVVIDDTGCDTLPK